MSERILFTVTLQGKLLQQHAFEAGPITVGRQGECNVVLDNPGVSRTHAEISIEDGRYYLNDLGSANGSFVNGKSEQRAELHDGDVVTIGKFELHVSIPSQHQDTADEGILQQRDVTIRAQPGSRPGKPMA